MTKIFIYTLLILTLISSALAQVNISKETREVFSPVVCDEKGSITFTREPRIDQIDVERVSDGKIYEDIPGKWDKKYIFTSESLLFPDVGEYVIRDSELGDRFFLCPGVDFHCALVNISVFSCNSQKNFTEILFNIKGADVEDLKFTLFGTDKKIYSHNKNYISQKLENLTINQYNNISGVYSIEIPYSPVTKEVIFTHSECKKNYYPYSKFSCIYKEDPKIVLENKKKLCNENKEIKEYLTCMLSLNKNIGYKDLYENICTIKYENMSKCLTRNDLFQNCLYINDKQKIPCVKSVLDINDLVLDGLQCNDFEGDRRNYCFNNWRNSIYDLIIFRFTLLQSKAIDLYYGNIISQDEFIDFYNKIEDKKIEFLDANSKEERKNIILKIRQDWIDLLK